MKVPTQDEAYTLMNKHLDQALASVKLARHEIREESVIERIEQARKSLTIAEAWARCSMNEEGDDDE